MAANITGINVSKIPTIQKAIDEWIAAIEAEDIAAKAKQIAVAIKGTHKEAEVKALCQSMTSYVENLTGKLRVYKTRLDEVKSAYANYDSKSSTAITDARTSVKNLKS